MKIEHLNIEVTSRCNQQCTYCFNDSKRWGKHTPYTPDQWIETLQRLKTKGLKSVHITGGEPFSWPGSIPLLAGAQKNGLTTSILSNGFRIPELAAENEDVFQSLVVAQISLDSMIPAIHDKRRGSPGAWQDATRAITCLHLLNVPIEISCVCDEENAANLDDILLYARSIGASVICRLRQSLGRAVEDVISENVRMAILRHASDGRVVEDRFDYVPNLPNHDHLAGTRNIWTCNSFGIIRGTHHNVTICDAA